MLAVLIPVFGVSVLKMKGLTPIKNGPYPIVRKVHAQLKKTLI